MGYLFIFYVFIFCWLVTRFKFFTKNGLANYVLIILFLVRVIAGLVSSYINVYYYQATDAIRFHQEGIVEYHLLFNNTYEYLTNIFHTNHINYSGFLESSGSFWNDTRTNIIAKILSIFNVFSGQNFFINTLFYNFLIFFGTIYCYRVFIKAFPSHKTAVLLCVFLLPSLVYFTSVIHRDGFIFLALSIAIYNIHIMMERKMFSFMRMFYVIIFLCFILLLRNFVFIILAPALIAWVVAMRYPRYAFISFLGIYILCSVLFFCSGFLSPKFNLPQHVSTKQIEFIEIAKNGGSAININPLYPNFRSFLNNAPQALNHSLMRPYLTEKFTILYIPAALEIFVYEILLVLFILFRNRDKLITPFVYFCFFFSISMFLVTGYTIPIIGAIVRYRSIYFPYLMIPIICFTDWKRIKKVFIYKKLSILYYYHQ